MATNSVQDQMTTLTQSGSLGMKMDALPTDIDMGQQLTGQIPEDATKKDVVTGDAFRPKELTQDRFPAIKSTTVTTEELKIPFTDRQLLGMGQAAERKVEIDWKKANPNISVTQVMNFANPKFKQQWNKYDAFENASGELISLAGMSEIERIDVADRFGATKMIQYGEKVEDTVTYDIPYAEKIIELVRLPDEIKTGKQTFDLKNMTYDQYTNLRRANRAFSTLVSPDKELGKAIHAMFLNEKLIEQGVGARGRYMILNDGMKNPTLDEFRRVLGGTAEAVGRFAVSAPLWGVGEALEFLTFDAFESDYEDRQNLVDSWWRPAAYTIQDKWADQNVRIPLGTAEFLSEAYTGFLPSLGPLALELVGSGKVEIGYKTAKSLKELRLFEVYKKDMISKNSELTLDQITQGFLDIRSKDLKFGTASMKRNRLNERLALAYQISDSTLDVAERAEVVQHMNYTSGLIVRRDALKAQIDKKPTPDLYVNLDKTLQRLEDANIRMFYIKRKSHIPKAIRDLNTQNNYILAGAGIGGFFVGEELGLADPAIGELVGMGVGLTLALISGKVAQGLAIIEASLSGNNKLRKKMKYVVGEMQNADPELQKLMLIQAEKIAGYQDLLISKGANPDVLDVALPIITDLATLRHFEETLSSRIALKDAISSTDSAETQKALLLTQRLNAELNKVLSEFQVVTEADQAFFDVVTAFKDSSSESIKRLQTNIDAVEKQGVRYYLDGITGKSTALDPLSPLTAEDVSDVKSFPEALQSLRNEQLLSTTSLSTDQFKGVIKETNDYVSDNLMLAANEIRSRVGSATTARASTAALLNKTVPNETTPSGLHSMHVELAHSSQRAIAIRPYEYLKSDNVQYFDLQNQPLEGVPTVDASDVFESFFNIPIPGVGSLSKITKTDLDASDLRAIDNTIVELTDSFFLAQAKSEGITKAQLIKNMKASFPEASFPKGRNDQSVLAELISKQAAESGMTLGFFDVTPAQAREIQSAVNSLQWKYKAQGETFDKMSNISNLIDGKFDSFEMNGIPVGQIRVKNFDNEFVQLSAFLEDANRGWRSYKSVWYDDVDGGRLPKLMDWGNRKKHPVDASHPGGQATSTPVNEWMSASDLVDTDKANVFMLSANKAFGQRIVGADGFPTKKIIKGTKDASTFKSYVQAEVGEELHRLTMSGDATQETIGEMLQAIENNIQVMNMDTGKMEPLFNGVDLLDDVLEYGSSKSISKQLRTQADTEAALKIKKATSAAIGPAKERRDALKEAQNIMNGFGFDKLTTDNVGMSLISGGRAKYNALNKAMSSIRKSDGALKYTPEQVKTAIADVYLQSLSNTLFTPTGRKNVENTTTAAGKSKVTEVPEYVTNVQGLVRALGNTVEQKQLVMDIIGKERYEVWEATAGFLAELNTNPLAQAGAPSLVSRGVPTSLSVESYISRLYAINRGVVRPQYVGTEAALQQLRNTNHQFLMSVLQDKELGREFLEMVRMGKPLDPVRNARFEGLLIATGTQMNLLYGGEEKEVVDVAGRKFTVQASYEDRRNMGVDLNENPEIFKGEKTLVLPSLDTIPQQQ